MKRSGLAAVVSTLGALAGACGGGATTPAQPPVTPPPALSPAPAPPPGVGANGCPLGNGVADADCRKATPRLLGAVEAAIDALVKRRPELFNTQEEAGAHTGQYRVLDGAAYFDGLVAGLQAAGFCAQRTIDGERIAVKDSNQFSEEWDVLTSSGFIRRGGYSYSTSCTPASFPLDAADVIAYVRTALWSYECDPGIEPPPPIQGRLPLGCDGRVTATPKQKNGRDVPSAIHGPDVRWELREGEDIVKLDADWRFADNPFNKLLHPTGRLGNFVVCATVLGKQGCLQGRTIP